MTRPPAIVAQRASSGQGGALPLLTPREREILADEQWVIRLGLGPASETPEYLAIRELPDGRLSKTPQLRGLDALVGYLIVIFLRGCKSGFLDRQINAEQAS